MRDSLINARPEVLVQRPAPAAGIVVPILIGTILLGAGLAGQLTAAWGYALFFVSGGLLGCGVLLFGVFMLSRLGDTADLARWFARLFRWGAWSYVFALCALAGFYMWEALHGRMEFRWMLFGPSVLGALIALDYGIYKRLIENNLPTWRRYRQFVSREASDPSAMRKTLLEEVVLQRTLFSASKLRWLRHTLIFWGFALMLATELGGVVLREGFPAFGWRDIWREHGNPVRLAFDFAYDFTGVMILAGCILALIWRAMVNNTPDRKYADTPTTVFLLLIVASGFIVEGLRIAADIANPVHAWSFAGQATARLLLLMGGPFAALDQAQAVWIAHALGSCVFIAYVPVMRLIHSCATPMGRLMNSQKGLLAAKKHAIIGGLFMRRDQLP